MKEKYCTRTVHGSKITGFRHSASKMLSVATASDALGADCWTENSALYLGTTGEEVPST